jgi:hypothetical protein
MRLKVAGLIGNTQEKTRKGFWIAIANTNSALYKIPVLPKSGFHVQNVALNSVGLEGR